MTAGVGKSGGGNNAGGNTAWVAVDWGTSQLRLWLMDAAGGVLGERRSGTGMAQLEPGDYESTLLNLLGENIPDEGVLTVICCGMVGARQGWVEAPYGQAPCAPLSAQNAIRVKTRDARLQVYILPGICQETPPDVMRGEETQIAGMMAHTPDFEGVVCLPGTHTKWVQVNTKKGMGQVVGFRTFMTGEVFALLKDRSVLRHAIAANGWDDAGFDAAVADALAAPESVAASLFAIRAESLLKGMTPGVARARLSGTLIGAELASMRPYWQGHDVRIIGEDGGKDGDKGGDGGGIAALYCRALSAQGARATTMPSGVMTRTGLMAAYTKIMGAKIMGDAE